jgi:hypothetical protein
MSEAHTADLGTRYRYRQEGRELERERIIKLLEQVAIQQQKVLDFNNQRKDASGREIVIATTYQLLALIKGEQK